MTLEQIKKEASTLIFQDKNGMELAVEILILIEDAHTLGAQSRIEQDDETYTNLYKILEEFMPERHALTATEKFKEFLSNIK